MTLCLSAVTGVTAVTAPLVLRDGGIDAFTMVLPLLGSKTLRHAVAAVVDALKVQLRAPMYSLPVVPGTMSVWNPSEIDMPLLVTVILDTVMTSRRPPPAPAAGEPATYRLPELSRNPTVAPSTGTVVRTAGGFAVRSTCETLGGVTAPHSGPQLN